jgi:hypothetical protein
MMLDEARSVPGARRRQLVKASREELTGEDNEHTHTDHVGLVHYCYHACPSWLKIIVVAVATEFITEPITFLPIHRAFEYLGLVS